LKLKITTDTQRKIAYWSYCIQYVQLARRIYSPAAEMAGSICLKF